MTMNSEIVNGCDRVIAAAANGIYQGIIIALLVSLVLRLLRRTNAATCHAIWFATLVLVACLIPAHCWLDYLVPARAAGASIGQSESIMPAPLSVKAASIPVEREEPHQASASKETPGRFDGLGASVPSPMLLNRRVLAEDALSTFGGEQFKPLFDPPKAGKVEGGADAPTPGSQPPLSASRDSVERNYRWRTGQFLQPISWNVSPGSKFPRIASLILLAAWLGVAGIKASFLVWRLSQIRKLNANAIPATQDLEELFQRLRRNLGVSRRVQLKMSPIHRSPILLGFFHPVVLLPAEQPVDNSETEAILRHELAHVRRRDDWANLVQHLIQALLFFHPAIWWISGQLSIQREVACDDYVLQQGGRARAYALLLADLASRIKSHRRLLAPGVTTSRSQLQKRIDMILNTQRDTSPRLAKTRLGFITTAAACLAALAIYAAPRLVLAQTPTALPSADNAAAINALPSSGVAPVVISAPPGPPDAPAPALAEPARPPSSTPPAVEPGPKVKSSNLGDLPVLPSIAAPATPALSAVVAVHPDPEHAPHIVAVPRLAASPRPLKSPDMASAGSNFEERLTRLEKMVESLLEQKAPQPPEPFRKDTPRAEAGIDKETLKQFNELTQQFQDAAKREAARAADQVKRASKDAEKAMRLLQERNAHGKFKEDAAKQLDALRRHRAMLEREVQDVERQIERLEQEQQKLQEEQEGRSELLEESAMNAEQLAVLEESCSDQQHVTAGPRE